MSAGEDIMREAAENAEQQDRTWMETQARAEQRAQQVEKLNARIVQPEGSAGEDRIDVAGLRETSGHLTQERDALKVQADQLPRSGLFDSTREEYSAASEALAWMERVNEGWELAGATPAEHVLHTVEHDDNIVDEGTLRALEASAFTRIEQAWRAGVPDYLRSRFVAELTRYARLSDHVELRAKASEIAKRIEAGS